MRNNHFNDFNDLLMPFLGKLVELPQKRSCWHKLLELVKSKCLQILLYGLECFSLNVSDIKSLDFTVTRFLMKLFKSSNINLINDSRYYFNFELPSELLMKRKGKFIEKFMASQSLLDYFAIQ